ncbi:pentapeptide repeat-containing protein [Streptomyces sp. NPDC048297]|uniref:pentapeptide repeat-containing protein n=1 Tax=Streptomyces sp. NPDC048297 TaxID=3365531 RepID=UPI00371063CB
MTEANMTEANMTEANMTDANMTETHMTDTWQTITRLATRLENHSTLPREQRILVQLLKIQEEAGEVAEAVIGALGQNPRKGHSHTWEDVEAEVCDVIVSAMVALTRMNPEAATVFARHMERIAARDLGGAAERTPERVSVRGDVRQVMPAR